MLWLVLVMVLLPLVASVMVLMLVSILSIDVGVSVLELVLVSGAMPVSVERSERLLAVGLPPANNSLQRSIPG